jgi:hypothetical protein
LSIPKMSFNMFLRMAGNCFTVLGLEMVSMRF